MNLHELLACLVLVCGECVCCCACHSTAKDDALYVAICG